MASCLALVFLFFYFFFFFFFFFFLALFFEGMGMVVCFAASKPVICTVGQRIIYVARIEEVSFLFFTR